MVPCVDVNGRGSGTLDKSSCSLEKNRDVLQQPFLEKSLDAMVCQVGNGEESSSTVLEVLGNYRISYSS